MTSPRPSGSPVDPPEAAAPVDQPSEVAPLERSRPPVEVEAVTETRLDDIARLHVEAFPDSVLGKLGVEAVRRNYHWQLTGPHLLTAVAAVRDGEVLGFLFGGVFRGSTIGFVKKEKWFLMRRVVAHPRILLRGVGWRRITLATRLLARRAPATQIEAPSAVPVRSFGVLAIAVSPRAQGLGIGRTLMLEAADRARDADFVGMHLTVHPDNTTAVSFYRGLGWEEVPDASGAWTGRMTFAL